MDELFVDWMNGIQFYLRKPVDIIARPHDVHRRAVGADRADPGPVLGRRATSRATTATAASVDCLSVDISDWDTPGILYGKPAKQLHARARSRKEVWAQIKAHLNDNGETC